MTVTALAATPTAVPSPRTARALRRVPPPATEPEAAPFDGAATRPQRQPALVAPARPRRAHGMASSALHLVDSEEWGPQPTPRAALPDPRVWARRLVTAVLEVQAGTRPPTQLARYLDERVYAAVRRARRTPTAPVSARLRSVRISEPDDGVVEATAVIERAGRCAAIALRLEGVDGRWVCTVFDALVPHRTAGAVRSAS